MFSILAARYAIQFIHTCIVARDVKNENQLNSTSRGVNNMLLSIFKVEVELIESSSVNQNNLTKITGVTFS